MKTRADEENEKSGQTNGKLPDSKKLHSDIVPNEIALLCTFGSTTRILKNHDVKS